MSIASDAGPLALGINWAHDSSAAICSPQGVLFGVAEERINRVKHYYGFPIEAIRTAFRQLGITGRDISVMAISTRKPLFPFHPNHVSMAMDGSLEGPGLTEFPDWRPGGPRGEPNAPPRPKRPEKMAGTSWEGFETRHWSNYSQALTELGLFDPGVRHVYISHHRAHAASAFRLSGVKGAKVATITLDGKGDGVSGSIYLGHEDGRMELIRQTDAVNSLGSFYQAVTEALGFVPVDGEYKTMGLAALGKAGGENPFDGIVHVDDGRTVSRIPWSFRWYNKVYPDSADSGLAVGAAMEALHLAGHATVTSLPTLYLGHAFTDDAIRAALGAHGDLAVIDAGDNLPAVLAERLAAGQVVGTFQGRLEMGPRALGHRSVLADAREVKVKDRINDILKGREWFVPFAPIVLEDEAPLYWDGPIDYRHMTFAVEASPLAKVKAPGVVHVDGTMRPQVVNETTSPWAFKVLNAFRDLTGMGLLINTSFNRHGLPIVAQPQDAIEHLRSGWVDGLAIGRFYVSRAS